jgi:hypothetical protein
MKKTIFNFFLLAAACLVTFAVKAQSNFSSKVIGVGVVVADLERSLGLILVPLRR